MSELHRRDQREAAVAVALRDFVDHLEVHPGPVPAPPQRLDTGGAALHGSARLGGRRVERVRRRSPGGSRVVLPAVAAALALVGVVLFALPRTTPVPAADASISLPTQLRGYRLINVPLTWSPPGRVLMSYEDRGDDEDFTDRNQTIVLGADARTYRSLPVAAADRHRAGSSAPVELSPDGSRIAIGSPRRASTVLVVDTAHGTSTEIRVTQDDWREIDPLTWSPDGEALFVLDRRSTASWPPAPGRLVRVDVRTGTIRALPGLDDVQGAAMSDDPARVLVVRSGKVDIVDAVTGAVVETVPGLRPDDVATTNAWSPDGSSILTFREDARTSDGRRPVVATLHVRSPQDRVWSTRSYPVPDLAIHPGGSWAGGAWMSDQAYLVSLTDGRIAQVNVGDGRWSEVARVAEPISWPLQTVTAPPRDRVYARDLVRHLHVTPTPVPAPHS